MKKILKTSLKILGYLIISLMIGYNVFLLNARFVLHEQLPMINGYGYAVVLSGSMQPAFNVDDLLIIQKCDSYEVGDIVTYVDSANDLVTHRITEIDDVSVVTQGDANNTADRAFRKERIKGKVVKILPGVGRMIQLFQNPFVIISVCTVILVLNHISYKKEVSQKEKRINSIRSEIEDLKNTLTPPQHQK
ncbi:MAG: signal peptidase I [Clostridia bacterium]|nr:signal peptidase I [Clostridia bacterium]